MTDTNGFGGPEFKTPGDECHRWPWKPARKEFIMTKATITYLLSEEGRKKSLLSGGDGKEVQTIETDITPELLGMADVDRDGVVVLKIGDNSYSTPSRSRNVTDIAVKTTYDKKPYFDSIADVIRFDTPQTPESLVKFETNRRAHLDARKIELQPEFDRLMAEYEAIKAEEESEKAQRLAEREAAEAKSKAKREQHEADKLSWVQAHGSDHLRDAVALGYDCQRQYVTERAEKEFPDYIIDFDERAEWKSRSCPSPKALTDVKRLVAAGHKAKVVWLTDDGQPYDPDCDDFESCEAIVIRGYLGKYDLVKIL